MIFSFVCFIIIGETFQLETVLTNKLVKKELEEKQ